VHRRVRDHQIARRSRVDQGGRLPDVRRHDIVTQSFSRSPERHVSQRADGTDRGLDLAVDRRDDLRAAAGLAAQRRPQIDLVSVVLGWMWLAVTITPAAVSRCRTA